MLDLRSPPKSQAIQALPQAFFEEIGKALREDYFSWPGADQWLSTKDGHHAFCMNQYYRMGQALELVIPWITAAAPLGERRLLEIGCGTGSSTFALATAAGFLRAVDIKAAPVAAARRRIQAGRKVADLCTVEFLDLPADWLGPSRGFHAEALFKDRIDTVLLYAVLEHLLPLERIYLLREIWDRLPKNGLIITYETPNRLSVIDWHTSKLPFADILPDELTALYYSRSERADFPRRVRARNPLELENVSRVEGFRFGRGVSFHEFELSIGLSNLRVVADGYSKSAGPRRYRAYHDFEAALISVLATLNPPVARGFAFPSLDLVIAKA